LDAIAPGTQPTKITPAASSGSIGTSFVVSQAASGITVIWVITPNTTHQGDDRSGCSSSGRTNVPNANMVTTIKVHNIAGVAIKGSNPTAPVGQTKAMPELTNNQNSNDRISGING
jgi:hypothetical protein